MRTVRDPPSHCAHSQAVLRLPWEPQATQRWDTTDCEAPQRVGLTCESGRLGLRNGQSWFYIPASYLEGFWQAIHCPEPICKTGHNSYFQRLSLNVNCGVLGNELAVQPSLLGHQLLPAKWKCAMPPPTFSHFSWLGRGRAVTCPSCTSSGLIEVSLAYSIAPVAPARDRSPRHPQPHSPIFDFHHSSRAVWSLYQVGWDRFRPLLTALPFYPNSSRDHGPRKELAVSRP